MAAPFDLDNPFWRFSLKVYAAPGVSEECLGLQSTLNVDINALLFGAWLGADKRLILAEEHVKAIAAHVRKWHESAVRPLRLARQSIKAMPEFARDEVKALRKDIAAAELRAEQIEQALLYADWQSLAAGSGPGAIEPAVRLNVAGILRNSMNGGNDSTVDAYMPRALISTAAGVAPSPA